MKLKFRWLFFGLVLLFIVYLIVYRDVTNLADRTEFASFFKYYQTANQTSQQSLKNGTLEVSKSAEASKLGDKKEWIPSEIVVAVVVCGDRLTETLVMLKSAILFSFYLSHDLRIVIFTENSLFQSFSEKLGEWQGHTNSSFQFELHSLSFPDKNGNEWRKLFKPCAAQRLFLPTLLSHLDRVLYVDTDVIFLAPLSKLWAHFDKMNSTQMAALSSEHEDPSIGWYNRFARHPYYGKTGVNSGVMLMHLAKMRSFGWSSYLQPIYNEFKLKLTWGDQDIINILFHFHPERLLVYSCAHNYRPDHCMYSSMCKEADRDGVVVVHGSRSSFHGEKQPAFKAIYKAMEEYQLPMDPFENLLLPMKSYLAQTTQSNCGKESTIFTKQLEHTFPQPLDEGFR
ncbi:hypothetical protein LSTR_LSTR007105 [Laodelphax striatellus]|uniref:UDP-D-xylose:beta-D-glucoside alpha-1,3-D-xylosyltransferase n=1 Tax=Laodelphax striatellus TaxID=195883 RepID=A0A482WEV4_LAOST|nr:hypothetical protein LSTR_LSTR007105 [Laodelphax striatellus]